MSTSISAPQVDRATDDAAWPDPAVLTSTLQQIGLVPDADAAGTAEATEATDAAPSTEIHPEVQRLWSQFQQDGHPTPSFRLMRAALKEAGVRIASTDLNAQLGRLRAQTDEEASRPAPEALDTALAHQQAMQQRSDALLADQREKEAALVHLDQHLAALADRARNGDPEAAAAIPGARQEQWLLHRELTEQFPLRLASAQAAQAEAAQAVTQAGRARDLAQRNTLSAAVQAAIAALVPELDAVHERIAAILATEQARYAVAMREGTPLGPSDAPPLARLVTAYVQHVFRDVAPAPQHAWHRIDVPDLVAAVQPLTAPLTAEDQAARAGTALVWLVYRGHQAPGVLGTVGIRLEGQAQQRFHHRQPVEVSYADYAKLKAHCGDAIMVVPPPVWPYR